MNKAVLFVFYDNKTGKVLSERRSADNPFYANLTTFLTGTIKEDESLEETFFREIKEELAVKPLLYQSLSNEPLEASKAHYLLYPYIITRWEGEVPNVILDQGNPLVWETLEEVAASPIPTRPQIVKLIKAYLMNEITLRPAVMEDLRTVQDMSTELAHYELPFDKDIDLQWAYKDGEKYYKDKIKKGLCMIAVINNEIVGYSTFGIKKIPSWRLTKVGELENLYVTSTFRGQGIGKRLIDHFIQWSKDRKVNKVAVTAFAPNEKALEIYRKRGFKNYDINLEKEL